MLHEELGTVLDVVSGGRAPQRGLLGLEHLLEVVHQETLKGSLTHQGEGPRLHAELLLLQDFLAQ